MAAGAGLAFILGIFQELVDSTDSSNFFEEISGAAPARPLQRFANPALLAVSFFLGALIVSFVFARGCLGHWMGAHCR